jgi:hypothetical protein|tara:strand:+ start:1157 stop:1561 length:405 start_codon:yes stop_codon:yes gene_type:complete
MDVDNNILLERYFSSHNSPYEKTYKVSKHIKFAAPQDFQKKLLNLYSESGTSNLPAIYKLVEETFHDQDMVLSHSENYKHIYAGVNGDYDIEGIQRHFLHPRPSLKLYGESGDLSEWQSLAICKRGTATALFRI